MDRSYSNFYGEPSSSVSPCRPPSGQRITTPSSQRRAIPKSPHTSRVNSVRKEPVPVAAVKPPTVVMSGGSSTIPRSPKPSRQRQQRQQQIQALHDENERLCDSVQETYMVRFSLNRDSDGQLVSALCLFY